MTADDRAAQRQRAQALVGKRVRFKTAFDLPAFPARTYLVTGAVDGMALLNYERAIEAHPDHLTIVEEER